MLAVKDKFYKTLCAVCKDVTDAYPQTFCDKGATVQYTEEENKPKDRGVTEGNGPSYVRYRIDIWDPVSTTKTACDIDAQLSSWGWCRTSCSDVNREEQFKHKMMRYEGYVMLSQDGTDYDVYDV